MRKVTAGTLVCALCLLGFCLAAAEDCNSLKNVGVDGLVSYLDATPPNDGNAECITFAIMSLAEHRYGPAISALVKLLDFRRPLNDHEKHHVWLHPPSIDNMYPAAGALEEIGEKAGSAVLGAIGSASGSPTARENAVAVWMQLHKYESSKGVALLKQEALRAGDPAVKENLKWALSKAPTWCNPNDKARCRAAAVIREP